MLFADEGFAIVYICDHVERDGSCHEENVEIEALARNTAIPPPMEVTNRIAAVLETACFSLSDFEKLDHSSECVHAHACYGRDVIIYAPQSTQQLLYHRISQV